ncbi:hypothetical protein Agub_g11010, partial [Astrephomene gubernaculifera]
PPPPPPSPPPPPAKPPPPPTLVQTHICPQGNVDVPYSVGNLYSTPTTDMYGNAAVAMCVKVAKKTCKTSSKCCAIDFAKVELPINSTCKPDVREIRINNAPVAYSWGFYDTFTTLKFVSLTKYMPSPDSGSLCWVVRQGTCARPETFCYNGHCQVNYYSSDNKCCPATLVS